MLPTNWRRTQPIGIATPHSHSMRWRIWAHRASWACWFPNNGAALAYAKERETVGKVIIEHQAVGFRLADMATEIEAARQVVRHASAFRDAGRPCLVEASMAKTTATDIAEKVCSDALQTLGGNGYLEDYPPERILRDAQVT